MTWRLFRAGLAIGLGIGLILTGMAVALVQGLSGR